MIKSLLLTAVAALGIGLGASAATIGYSNGNQGRDYLFRTSTIETGLAIRLPQSKAQMLQGRKITAIQLAMGTKNAVDNQITLFIGSALGTPVYTQTAKISSANKWLTFTLDQPYTISGNEEIYLGYTATMMGVTYSPLSADKSMDLPGACFAYNGTAWADIAGDGHGCANIRAVLDDGADFTDLLIKPFKANGYFKAGQDYAFTTEVFNFGTQAMSNISLKANVGDGTPVTMTLDGEIAPGASKVVSIDQIKADADGVLPIHINIEGSDDDASDNIASTDFYFYPQDMERAILLEGFTGQDCSNCPRGHKEINQVVDAWTGDEVVEISHHCGFQPDQFTMSEDYDYTYFYQGSMYAPAVSVNRQKNAEKNLPIFNCSVDGITDALYKAAEREPYVSLEANSTFNPETRKLHISVDVFTHRNLPSAINAINVALCQNNIEAMQVNGGSDYRHNAVFRGCLTGNSWGIGRDFVAGQSCTLEIDTILPEAIYSSYYTEANLAAKGYTEDMVTWPIDPDNMYLVAYVAAFDENDVNGHNIYNCVKIPLGGSKTQGGHAGIEEMLQSQPQTTTPKYYDLMGRRINQPQHGIYVKVQNGKVRKIKS